MATQRNETTVNLTEARRNLKELARIDRLAKGLARQALREAADENIGQPVDAKPRRFGLKLRDTNPAIFERANELLTESGSDLTVTRAPQTGYVDRWNEPVVAQMVVNHSIPSSAPALEEQASQQ